MKKLILTMFFGLFLAITVFSQESKTGIAYLLPVENIVSKVDENQKAKYPMYQRWKIMLVNPLTLLPDNPQNPQSVLLYVKIKDALANALMSEIIEKVKVEPVVLDGTLFKAKKKNFLYRKGDVEITEAFQVDNWAPLSLAKQRISQVTDQVLVDVKKLDSALQVTDQIIAENQKLQQENEKLKTDAQKEKLAQQKEKQPVKENVPPPTKEQKRRENIVIQAVKPSGT